MGISWEKAKEETKDDAELFIEMIKSKKITKRIFPNESVDFPIEEAFESFDHFTKRLHYCLTSDLVKYYENSCFFGHYRA
jgi:hypothetical protein